jgi:hypothetical protein
VCLWRFVCRTSARPRVALPAVPVDPNPHDHQGMNSDRKTLERVGVEKLYRRRRSNLIRVQVDETQRMSCL